MQISLTAEQEALIQSHAVAHGLGSIEEAAQALLAEKLAELELDADDLEWAKPFVDEAREAVARGAFLTMEQYREKLDALLSVPAR